MDRGRRHRGSGGGEVSVVEATVAEVVEEEDVIRVTLGGEEERDDEGNVTVVLAPEQEVEEEDLTEHEKGAENSLWGACDNALRDLLVILIQKYR